MVTVLTVMDTATTVIEATATMTPGDTENVVKEITEIVIVKDMVAAEKSTIDLHGMTVGENLVVGEMRNLLGPQEDQVEDQVDHPEEGMDVANVTKTTAAEVAGNSAKAWERLSEDPPHPPKQLLYPSESERRVVGMYMHLATSSTPPCRRNRQVCGLQSMSIHGADVFLRSVQPSGC